MKSRTNIFYFLCNTKINISYIMKVLSIFKIIISNFVVREKLFPFDLNNNSFEAMNVLCC